VSTRGPIRRPILKKVFQLEPVLVDESAFDSHMIAFTHPAETVADRPWRVVSQVHDNQPVASVTDLE
jgi:hypothetical protein